MQYSLGKTWPPTGYSGLTGNGTTVTQRLQHCSGSASALLQLCSSLTMPPARCDGLCAVPATPETYITLSVASSTAMSWTGLKKAISRAGNHVMVKAGHIEQSLDLEFDYEEKRYRAMEKLSEQLHKELRRYKDSLHLLAHSQSSVGDVLAGFYGKDSKSTAKEYQTACHSIEDEALAALDQPFHQTVLNPVSRFNSYYVDVNEAIKKRARKKLDYDSLRSKVKKLTENPLDDAAYDGKVKDSRHELALAQDRYDKLNEQLKAELPRLMDLRVSYLNPLFEAFVKIQLRYFHENYLQLNRVLSTLDAQTRDDFASGRLELKIDGILDKVRELNLAL